MIKILSPETMDKITTLVETEFDPSLTVLPASPASKAVAQAQLKDALRQVVEWGEEDCPHKTFRWKQNCWACWQELTKEAEEEG